jgi:hypothetical protein
MAACKLGSDFDLIAGTVPHQAVNLVHRLFPLNDQVAVQVVVQRHLRAYRKVRQTNDRHDFGNSPMKFFMHTLCQARQALHLFAPVRRDNCDDGDCPQKNVRVATICNAYPLHALTRGAQLRVEK